MHVNVGYVEIDGPFLDEEAIEIASFDDWKPGQQRFALYLRQPVDGAPRGAKVAAVVDVGLLGLP